MITIEVKNGKEIETKFNYVKFFAGRGAAEGINGELVNLKNLANTNLVPKGVSQSRPGESIMNNWRMKTAYSSEELPMVGTLYNVSPHACVIGSISNISIDIKNHKPICEIKPNDEVFSKDGKLHKVKSLINHMKVISKPNLIQFKCEHSYLKNGLILTDDHLVLTYDVEKKYAYWEEIGKLHIGDYVIKKIKTPYNKGTRRVGVCKCCGEVFKARNSKQKYCSQKCHHLQMNHGHNKGIHMKMPPSHKLHLLGQNNPSWKGGISKLPYGPDWTKCLKEEVKKRDGYICQICRIIEQDSVKLVVHHRDSNKFNNSKDNLITLCPKCHGKLHGSRDCELVEVDWDNFKPERITKLIKIDAKKEFKHNRCKITKLYDLSIENENSFVVDGIVVHNSFVEVGTGPYAETNYFGMNYNRGTQFILPKKSKLLKFIYNGSLVTSPDPQKRANTGNYIFARYVEGQEPKTYLGRAVLSQKNSITKVIGNYMFNDIKRARGI